jgi:MoxR-like ATPase
VPQRPPDESEYLVGPAIIVPPRRTPGICNAWPVTLTHFENPAHLAGRLSDAGYLADPGLAAAAFLATRLNRPLFLEGAPGAGKTSFADAMGDVIDVIPIRLQCYAGIEASQALYDWNFPRQILHLRAAAESADREQLVKSLYEPEFLIERPILRAIQNAPSVLLIDEIDRADDEFEALLLEFLDGFSVSIPELGTITADSPPLVVLTSNRTRDVHDALKRRCLYHWIADPDLERETSIVRRRVTGAPEQLARDVAKAMQLFRSRRDRLIKPPGVAESIELAKAALELGATSLTPDVLETALATVVKHQEDDALVRREILPEWAATARSEPAGP